MRICVAAFALSLAMTRLAVAQAPQPMPDDYRVQEFAARPAPDWVHIKTHGADAGKLAGFRLADAFKVEVVAEEPIVLNPVALSFDEQGRAYVIQWNPAPGARLGDYEVTYQDGTTSKIRRMFKDSRDDLRRLEDTNGDGIWDKSVVVMNDLEMTSSATVHDGWFYLPSVGHLLRRKIVRAGETLEAKTLGPAPIKRLKGVEPDTEIIEQEIVKGFCGFTQHQVSGVTVGSDGWIYLSSGDDDNKADGADGSRVTVLRCGVIYRCRPDGTDLHEVARGFRNPYRSVAVDRHYNIFHIDNDQEDGSKFTGCRIMHVLDGQDFGWRLYPGAVCCRVDNARGAVFGERPGKMPSLLKTGRGAPAGLLAYQGSTVEKLDGWLIYPDVVRKLVRAYLPERSGTSFKIAAQFDLMANDDGMFRPCEAVQGPDGAIYIVDWRHNGSGAGNLWGNHQTGRIYRLTSASEASRPALDGARSQLAERLKQMDEKELLTALSGKDSYQRRATARELAKRFAKTPADGRGTWQGYVFSKTLPSEAVCELLGAICEQAYDDKVQMWLTELSTRDGELGRCAAELFARNATLKTTHPNVATQIARFKFNLTSAQLEAKRTSVLALSKIGQLYGQRDTEIAKEIETTLVTILFQDRSNDAVFHDALVRAIERLGETAIRRVSMHVSERGSANKAKALAFFEATRTRPAARAVDGLLFGDLSHLSSEELGRLIASYRNYQLDPPISVAMLVAWLSTNQDAPAPVLLTGLETVAVCAESGCAIGDEESLQTLALGLLNNSDEPTRLTTIESIGAAGLNALAPTLAQALQDTKRSEAERRAIVRSLSRLRSIALAFLSTRTPPGVERVLDQLVAAANDPQQGMVRADILTALTPIDFSKAEPIARQWLDSKESWQVATAIDLLGTRPADAKLMAERFIDQKLDRSFLPNVSTALQRHLDKDANGEMKALLASILKAGLLVDPNQTAELVAKSGNPERGRVLYLDRKRTQCATCHKLEGVGGQVGPDLTKVWQTHSIPKLVEALLEPSKEIKEGFATWTITTKKGQVFNGLKISENKREVVLRDAQGNDVRLLGEDIEEQIQSKRSLMPDGLASQLSLNELVDLIAFLKSQSAQAGLATPTKP